MVVIGDKDGETTQLMVRERESFSLAVSVCGERNVEKIIILTVFHHKKVLLLCRVLNAFIMIGCCF